MNQDFDDLKGLEAALTNHQQELSRADHLADGLYAHAMHTPYTGPSVPGDQFAGWPRAIIKKHAPMPSIGLTAGGVGGRTPPRLFSLHDMLCMRMRWHNIEDVRNGFDHVAVHSAGDRVFVWVITKDTQTVTMEDDETLFPSDALITKLRLLQQE